MSSLTHSPLLVAVALLTITACYSTHEFTEIREVAEAGLAETAKIRLEIAAGRSSVRRAGETVLFDLQMRYCGRHFVPVIRTETQAEPAVLRAGLKRIATEGEQPPPGSERNDVTLLVGSAVPVDLSLVLGAGQNISDLGGLRLSRLDVATDAGATTISFMEPLVERPGAFLLSGGPGRLTVRRLGNASPEQFLLSAIGGEFVLDLSGAWKGQPYLQLDVRIGDLLLLLPRGPGVELTIKGRDPSSLVLPEFRLEDGVYLRPGTEGAPVLSIRVSEGLGSVEARPLD